MDSAIRKEKSLFWLELKPSWLWCAICWSARCYSRKWRIILPHFFFMTLVFDKLTRQRRDTARVPGLPINIDAATITQYHSSGTAQFTATFNWFDWIHRKLSPSRMLARVTGCMDRACSGELLWSAIFYNLLLVSPVLKPVRLTVIKSFCRIWLNSVQWLDWIEA